MARMIAEVCDALRSAGADKEKARAAAIALEDPVRVDQLGQRLEAQIAGFEDRLIARIDGLESRIGGVEGRIDGLEQETVGLRNTPGQVEQRLDRVEHRLDTVEQRLVRLERDTFVIKWMMGFCSPCRWPVSSCSGRSSSGCRAREPGETQ